MSLLDIGPVIFGGTEGIISWMQSKRLLAQSKDCSTCNVPMVVGLRSDVSDGHRLEIELLISK